jgi:hypothetical protein
MITTLLSASTQNINPDRSIINRVSIMRLMNSLLAASVLALGQLANAQEITPGARSLTIEELNGFLATETKKEFE